MSWDLVQETDTGWKKYRVSEGNFRYKRPNGQFANQSQWNGAQSAVEETTDYEPDFDPEPEPEPEPDFDTGFEPEPLPEIGIEDFRVNDVTEKWRYELALDYALKEPAKDMDSFVLEYPSIGVTLSEYKAQERMRKVEEINDEDPKDWNHDRFGYGIKYKILDSDGMVVSDSRQTTTFRDTDEELPRRTEFQQILERLNELRTDYGEILITHTTVHVRVL